MQNAASTASAAEYPSKSIADIAVEFLCVLCGSRSAQSAGLSDRMTCQTQPFDHPRIFAVADGLLSRLDTLDSAGPAESVSQTQPKTGAGLASCDVTTRIERLGGFGCMRSGDGQSACQYLESNADQRAAQLSTAPATHGSAAATIAPTESTIHHISNLFPALAERRVVRLARPMPDAWLSTIFGTSKDCCGIQEVCSETAGHHPRPSQCRLVQIEARIRDRAGTSKRSRRHRLPWRGRLPRPR
jgi:hypothetical protein